MKTPNLGVHQTGSSALMQKGEKEGRARPGNPGCAQLDQGQFGWALLH